MKSFWAFILCTLVGIAAYAQNNGGSGDGFQLTVSANQNLLTNIYTGGNNDGYSSLSVSNLNPLANIYAGGSNDGFDSAFAVGQNPLANIYTGGFNDGSDSAFAATQNPMSVIYFGGNNDGFNQAAVINQNPLSNIYLGGNNDGYVIFTAFNQNPFCIGGTAIWNGSVSIAWENPANWDCGILPNNSSTVIIPSGRPRYPTVSFSYEIMRLYLQPDASVMVMPGVTLILNGQ